MWRTVFVAALVGATAVWTSTTTALAWDSNCAMEQLERELQEYVKLESWQKLFSRHYKFFVDQNGDLFSEGKRLKFNTIIHNAIYGCDHKRDDEVDDCPNIYRGSIKTCKMGLNLRSAMFKTARCMFVELSIKHLVLADALMNTFPESELHRLQADVDEPIRRFGRTVADALALLGRGDWQLGELMALNLYLNNRYGTVLMHRVPAEPLTGAADLAVARERARLVHRKIADGLSAFWSRWCSDRDVDRQYRRKYDGDTFVSVHAATLRNTADADALLRSLYISGDGGSGDGSGVDLDPGRIALTDYADGLIAGGSMPVPMLADLRLRAFEASYEFDPRALARYHRQLFRSVSTCFYWTAVVYLRLGVRIVDLLRDDGDLAVNRNCLLTNVARFVRPLAVFVDIVGTVPAAAAAAAAAGDHDDLPPPEHLGRLLAYSARLYRTLRNDYTVPAVLAAREPIGGFADLLSADMEASLGVRAPAADAFAEHGRDAAVKLFESNYRALVRLVSAASRYRDDRVNLSNAAGYMSYAAAGP